MTTCTMLLGLAIAPLGWVLMLAATVTPQWQEFHERPGYPQDVSFSDGLWESCVEVTSIQGKVCQPLPEEMAVSWPILLVRALTVSALLVGFLSYGLANAGVRWWTEHSNNCLEGVSGLLYLLSGLVYLCATSYMAYRIIANITNLQVPEEDKYHLGTCFYLGWSGGAAETFAGVCLATSFQRVNYNCLRNLSLPYDVDY
ncbi:claudin-7-like [Sphaerodactylus townsendi]|uniref:claudin-7-like n=1 Tax=Sphaerodactylus townsendi TaxID=933632 RepID=UPI002026CCFB|nr:claudin-7-like [Sphaerodactylus townsendi]